MQDLSTVEEEFVNLSGDIDSDVKSTTFCHLDDDDDELADLKSADAEDGSPHLNVALQRELIRCVRVCQCVCMLDCLFGRCMCVYVVVCVYVYVRVYVRVCVCVTAC